MVQPPVITAPPPCQSAGLGTDLTLSVGATGTGLSYQWLFNGNPIAGATGSSLTMTVLQFTTAGVYSVEVRNSAGSVTNSTAVVNVVPRLSARRDGEYLVLSWEGGFPPQTVVNVAGPYAELAGVSSPYRVLASEPHRFSRLGAGEFSVTMIYLTGEPPVPVLEVTGVRGLNFMLQACYDFVAWVDLQIATAPFTYVDENAGTSQFRWYRAVPILECAPAAPSPAGSA